MFFSTPNHHIEIIQVKKYNAGQTVWHRKFYLPDTNILRERGYVVQVAQKNGGIVAERYCRNVIEATGWAYFNYSAPISATEWAR